MAATENRPAYTARPGEAVRVFRDENGNFAIGVGRITIASDDIGFVAAVVEDLGRLVHTPEGESVLSEGDATGCTVKIVKPDPPTEPPNGWVIPDDIASAAVAGIPLERSRKGSGGPIATGAGCGSTIFYNPADWPRPGDPHSPTNVQVLLAALRQTNTNAEGRSDPSAADWGTRA
jgi:hypothetical protein